MTEEKKLNYYQKNKHKYQKGGAYYKYQHKEISQPKIPIIVKKGKFIISLD